jgi:hypothetical protein
MAIERRRSDVVAEVVLPILRDVMHIEGHAVAAVCTQCCDIENANGRKGIFVAPVKIVPPRTTTRSGGHRFSRHSVRRHRALVVGPPVPTPLTWGDRRRDVRRRLVLDHEPQPPCEGGRSAPQGQAVPTQRATRFAYREKLGASVGRPIRLPEPAGPLPVGFTRLRD